MISENYEIQDQLLVSVKPGIFQGDSKDEGSLQARIEMEGFELEIIPIEKGRRDSAIDLIHDVFVKYEAPDYSSERIEMFQKTAIHNQDFLDKLEMYGAYQGKHLIGVILSCLSEKLAKLDSNQPPLGYESESQIV